MNAFHHRPTPSLLRAALMGTVALGLLAACGDETDVSEAPAVVEDETAAVEPVEPADSGADVVVVRPPEAGSGATGTAGAGSGSSDQAVSDEMARDQMASAGQPLDPAAFAGEARNAIGTPFRSSAGEEIGEVSDVLRNGDDQPDALIVTLAENDRMVRVPLGDVRVRPGERELLAAGDAETVRGLPTFTYSGDDNAVIGEDGQGSGASR